MFENPNLYREDKTVRPISLEQVLAEYRVYVNDPKAELPQEIIDQYYLTHRTENDGKT